MSHLRASGRLKAMYARRNTERTAINMVSLMDIFTILIFFLLVNSSEVDVLPSSKAISLPESVAEKKPKETLVVIVNDKNIVLQGRELADVGEVLKSTESTIPALSKELAYQLKRQLATHDPSKPFKGRITIMGDQKIPYSLLKKIMLTCTKAKYSSISLAVVRKAKGQE